MSHLCKLLSAVCLCLSVWSGSLLLWPRIALASAPSFKVIAKGGPVIALANGQSSGQVWALTGGGIHRHMALFNTSGGAAVRIESVSPSAVAIAQFPDVEVAVGTSNKARSAIVLYGPTATFLAAVRASAPVTSLAVSPDGRFVYALESTTPQKTLFVFNKSYKGFSYKVNAKSVSVAAVAGGSDAWILQSNGVLNEMSFIPQKIVKTIDLHTTTRYLVARSDGGLLFVTEPYASKSNDIIKVISPSKGRATIIVPKRSGPIALSSDGTTLFSSISSKKVGLVVEVPL